MKEHLSLKLLYFPLITVYSVICVVVIAVAIATVVEIHMYIFREHVKMHCENIIVYLEIPVNR